jgi:protein phosphatase
LAIIPGAAPVPRGICQQFNRRVRPSCVDQFWVATPPRDFMSDASSSTLEIAGYTDAGLVRSQNEDSLIVNARLGFVVLADGMGGYNAGEVASGMATTLLAGAFEKVLDAPAERVNDNPRNVARSLLLEEIQRANTAIYYAAESQPQYAGMGTTLVAAMFYDAAMTVAHIGDSRLYRLRGDDFQQVTRDHSLLQEQLDSGLITPEQARYSQNKNLVTRALGVDPHVEAEIRDYETLPGDIYLLCSDGLNDMVEDRDIAQALKSLSDDLDLCSRQLLQMANDSGGRDNVTVALVRILARAPVARSWWSRLLALFR